MKIITTNCDRSLLPEAEINLNKLPKHALSAICLVLSNGVEEAFKDPVVISDYKKWLIKRYGKHEGKKRFDEYLKKEKSETP